MPASSLPKMLCLLIGLLPFAPMVWAQENPPSLPQSRSTLYFSESNHDSLKEEPRNAPMVNPGFQRKIGFGFFAPNLQGLWNFNSQISWLQAGPGFEFLYQSHPRDSLEAAFSYTTTINTNVFKAELSTLTATVGWRRYLGSHSGLLARTNIVPYVVAAAGLHADFVSMYPGSNQPGSASYVTGQFGFGFEARYKRNFTLALDMRVLADALTNRSTHAPWVCFAESAAAPCVAGSANVPVLDTLRGGFLFNIRFEFHNQL